MLELPSLVVWAGEPVQARLYVENDGPELGRCDIEAFFRGKRARLTMAELLSLDSSGLTPEEAYERLQVSVVGQRVMTLPGHRPSFLGVIVIDAPDVPGNHDLVVKLRDQTGLLGETSYSVRVVVRRTSLPSVNLLGTGPTADAFREIGVFGDPSGPVVVGEGALEPAMRPELERILAGGGTVVLLAQSAEAASGYPTATRLQALAPSPGSPVLRFTTAHPAVPSLPRGAALTSEDATLEAIEAIASISGRPLPTAPVVVADKPVWGVLAGSLVGEHRVGPGRLLFCQYRLCAPVLALDPAAQALLADLVVWAAEPVEPPRAEIVLGEDGATVRLYSLSRP